MSMLTTAAQLEAKYLNLYNFCCSLFLFSDDDMEASASSDSDDASKDNTVCIIYHILRMNSHCDITSNNAAAHLVAKQFATLTFQISC